MTKDFCSRTRTRTASSRTRTRIRKCILVLKESLRTRTKD